MLLHNRVIAVHFKDRLYVDAGLSHRFHHALHLEGRIIFIDDDTRRTVRKALAEFYFFDFVAERFFNFFDDRFKFFFFFFGFGFIDAEFVVAAGSVYRFQFKVFVFSERGDNDIRDVACDY